MTNIVDGLHKLGEEFADLVKVGIGEKRKAIEIQKLTESVGKYIHFSDSDRSGISFNKDVHPGNPRGFYGYPLTPDKAKAISNGNRDAFDDYGHRKYIYVFDATGNVLNLDKFDLETEFNKLLNYVENSTLKYKSTLSWMRLEDLQGSRPSYKLLWFMQQIVRMLGGNEHSAMNSLYRKLGYDVILTNTGGLGDDIREQVIVLTPSSINILHKLENPLGLTKEEVEEDRKYQAEAKARREENEKQWAKEKEERDIRMAEYEKKEKERLAERAKYEEERLAYWANRKNVVANKITSLQTLLKTGEISVYDVETLKELAEIAFLDYAKTNTTAIVQAGTLLLEKNIIASRDNRVIIGFLKASTKL